MTYGLFSMVALALLLGFSSAFQSQCLIARHSIAPPPTALFTSNAGGVQEEEKKRGRLSSLTNRIKVKVKSIRNKTKTEEPEYDVYVQDVHELRTQVLQHKIPLQRVGFNLTSTTVNATTVTTEQLQNHSVLQLLAHRIQTNSTPSSRAINDTAHLALAIEGGGMRGAVSAGMAAAIASLGLTDAFDSIYGSSAGCIVGAYMISRQMCVDVYTEVLPAAGTMFASKTRVLGNVGVGYVSDLYARWKPSTVPLVVPVVLPEEIMNTTARNNSVNATIAAPQEDRRTVSKILDRLPVLKKAPSMISSLRPYLTLHPGMNLTFVIEGIMSSTSGLRPFDMETFRKNDAQQPLRAVSSTVRAGKMETVAFGSKDGDFWDLWEEEEEEEEDDSDQEELLSTKDSRIRRLLKAVRRRLSSVVRIVVVTPLRKTRNAGRRFLGREIIISPVEVETGADKDTELRDELEQEPPRKGMASLLLRKTRNAGRRLLGREIIIPVQVETPPRPTIRKRKLVQATACPNNSGKNGLFACLESSMLVPGAAGPPVKLLRSKRRKSVGKYGLANSTNVCFDAFCYEPIPYRSAVENGATHVLALRSRPDGCFLETKPYTYEKIVAPVYFRLNGLPQVGEFFEKGGSQYRYVEDVLTLDEGLAKGCHSKPVRVPPTDILSGTRNDNSIVVDPETWSEAHLLPVICKAGTPELPALTQEKAEVVNAVRDGYVAAFDMLAPIAGLQFDPKTVDTRKIAEMVFPMSDDEDVNVLDNPVVAEGAVIERWEQEEQEEQVERLRKRERFARWMTRKRKERNLFNTKARRNPLSKQAAAVEVEKENPGMVGGKKDSLDWLEAEALLAALPGFRSGKLPHLAGPLRSDPERLDSDSSSPDSSTDDTTEEYV